MKSLLIAFSFISCVFTAPAFAAHGDFVSADAIENRAPDKTECAANAFADALRNNASAVSDQSDEKEIETWIRQTFALPDVLRQVVACPEIQAAAPTDTIKFMPIQHTFPTGRTITINYETQPKVLTQRIALGDKRDLPPDTNPEISEQTGIWTNTDPAWYGILVVQSGTLDKFVGPDKNNTISLKYIEDNIDTIYPHGTSTCTNRAGLGAADNAMINLAATKTVGLKEAGEKDTNDYYVAGKRDLRWIAYAEIALDVVLTIATYGGWTAANAATKGARASKLVKNLGGTVRNLSRLPSVRNYINILRKSDAAVSALNNLDKIADASRTADRLLVQLRNTTNATTRASILKQLNNLTVVGDAGKQADYLRKLAQLENTADVAQRARIMDEITDLKRIDATADAAHRKSLTDEIENAAKTMKQMEDADENVRKYKSASNSITELNALRHGLDIKKIAKRGNVTVRAFNFLRANKKANKIIKGSSKLGRASTVSGRARDWLFNSTMRNAGIIAKLGAKSSLLMGIVKVGADLYDYTDVSTDEYTNGIEFKPLGLLSADDIQGAENEVNYGMWLMWLGDATSAADDDAAYLQAMDFAAKFHQDLELTMQEHNSNACNVDIYVVRPIIRNPDQPDAAMYYLIMNDTPWHAGE